MKFRNIESRMLSNNLPETFIGCSRFSETFPSRMVKMKALVQNKRHTFDIIEFYGEFVTIDNNTEDIKIVIPGHNFIKYDTDKYVISDKVENFVIGDIKVKLSNPIHIGHTSRYPDSFVCDVEKFY